MHRFFATIVVLLACFQGFAQLSLKDSTMQAITYWANKENQTYHVVDEKVKVKSKDTTSVERIDYDVEITVKDSTANSYTLEWRYKNYKVKTDNKFTQKLVSIAEDIPVVFKTNEMGVFQEVVNWEQMRDYISKATESLRFEFKDTPKIAEVTAHVANLFSSKQAIESAAIKDIQQFHSFYAGKYKLGEVVKNKGKIAGLYGGDPFDAEVSVVLDEINEKEETATLKYSQTVDSEQITKATLNYLQKLAKSMGTPVPKKEDLPPMTMEDVVATSFHAPSGWVLYSISTREVNADDTRKIDRRTIELVSKE